MNQPSDALREAHELLGEVYALMLNGEVGLTNGAGGGIWVLPDRIAAWLKHQDAGASTVAGIAPDLRAMLLELRPMTAYGVVGSRDVDQARYRRAIDGAIALLASLPSSEAMSHVVEGDAK